MTECDWWQQSSVSLNGEEVLKVTCVPAQHFSGGGRPTAIARCGRGGRSTRSRRAPARRVRTLPATRATDPSREACLGGGGYPTHVSGVQRDRRGTGTVRCVADPHRRVPAAQRHVDHPPCAARLGARPPRCPQQTLVRNPLGILRLTPEDVNEPPKLLIEEAKRQGIDPNEFATFRSERAFPFPSLLHPHPLRRRARRVKGNHYRSPNSAQSRTGTRCTRAK